MLKRCYNKNYNYYHRYGGRGIKVCDRWNGYNGFVNFTSDMGKRPFGYQIDRIDNNDDYCKKNCRWANKFEQMANTSGSNGIAGVNWLKGRNKYRARIKVHGNDIHLGLFIKFKDAVAARIEAEQKYVPSYYSN